MSLASIATGLGPGVTVLTRIPDGANSNTQPSVGDSSSRLIQLRCLIRDYSFPS
jgi:hypothetical protein